MPAAWAAIRSLVNAAVLRGQPQLRCKSKTMYREYRAAAAANVGNYDAFIAVLASFGLQMDEKGIVVVGLCLAQDWLAAWHHEQGRLPL